MSTATFDTLKFAQNLEQAGLEPKQAAAFAKAQKEALIETFDNQVATKADIQAVRSEMTLIKWMLGFNLTLSFALLPMIFTILWKLFS